MKIAAAVLALSFATALFAADDEDYKRPSPNCKSCTEIEALLEKHNTELSNDKKLEYALKVAAVIEKISLKGKNKTDQRREIYHAINGTVQVLDDDFDSETAINLVGLRAQAPKEFDYVFWRIPIGQQNSIVERMKAAKEDGLTKKPLPQAKEVDP